jgi:predicted permease
MGIKRSGEVWAIRWLEDYLKDSHFALRQLRKAPGFTTVAVLSLALGIGANTATFTLIESTLLRPIALQHPDRLRLLTWREQWGGWVPPNLGYRSPAFGTIYEQRSTADGGLMHVEFTPRIYEAFRGAGNLFDSLFAFKEIGRLTAVVDGNAEPVNCFLVSGDFYRGMEVSPVIGRAIGPEDDAPRSAGSVVLISYQYWTRRFARSPSVIGKKITLNEAPVTIIGVNPEYFTGVEPGASFEVWAPMSLPSTVYGTVHHGADSKTRSANSLLDDANAWDVPMMGRLKPGVSDSRAQSVLDALFQRQVDANPGPIWRLLKNPQDRPRLILQSAARGVDYLTERYDGAFWGVLVLAGLVLLIACANVANLLLAKSAVRQREISLRLALGAGRWRIARQLFAEGLLLAALAGILGLAFGYWSRNAIPSILSTAWRPNPFAGKFDPKALLFSIAITFLTGILFSVAPMWQSRRVEVNEALKDASRGTAGLSKLRIGRLLVVLQVATSALLLAGAGLCVKTFMNLANTPLGFQPRDVLLFSVDVPRLHYPAERIRALLDNLQGRLSAIPGVRSATFTSGSGYTAFGRGDHKPGQTYTSYGSFLEAGNRFFDTLGIRILNGRAIDEHDRPNSPRVAVVNQEFVRRMFQGANPIGQIFVDSSDTRYQIVGVCADWRVDQFRDPVRPAFYSALIQDPSAGTVNFAVKLAGNEAAAMRQIRELIRSADPNLALADLHTEQQQIDSALSEERTIAALAAILGVLALLLAAMGIYGVMAYAVARRTSEIGIRVALGARPQHVAWLVLRETLAMGAVGLALGVPAVLALSPVLNHLLSPGWRMGYAFGVKPDDPLILTLAALLLGSVALLAGYLPARGAAMIDPMTALRHD